MKTIGLIFALSALVISAAAHADTLVYKLEAGSGVDVTGVEYGVNAKLGRAWLKIELYDRSCSGGDSCDASGEDRAKAEGLTYDAATEQVLYTEAGSAPVVCAKVVHHRFVTKWTTVDATGNCGITKVVDTTETSDDGYETHETKYSNYYFGEVPNHGRRGN